MAEATKTPIDAAFEEVNETFGSARTVRREMIEMLRKQITKCQITEFDKALMITAKMSVIKTLDDLLKSDSEISVKRLKMQLARKDSETNGAVGATIVNLIKSIRATGEMFPEDKGEVDSRILRISRMRIPTSRSLMVSWKHVDPCLQLTAKNLPHFPRKKKKMKMRSDVSSQCGHMTTLATNIY